MIKIFRLIFTLLILLSISCKQTEYNPGIDTDKDLEKTLTELIIEYPELIERDASVEESSFKFNNKCYMNENRDKLLLHSLSFDTKNREIVLLRFSDGKIGKVVEIRVNKFSNSDYTLNINDKYLEINQRYTNHILFKGIECDEKQ